MSNANPIQCYFPDPRLPIRVITHRGTFEHDAYPEHVHEDVTWELCYIVQGQVTAVSGGVRRRLGPGEVLVLGPDEPHGFDAWTGKHLTLMFRQKVLNQTPISARGRRQPRLEMAGGALPPHVTVAPQRRPLLEHVLEALRQEAFVEQPLKGAMSSLLLSQLLLELMRNSQAGPASPGVVIRPASREMVQQFCAELRATLDYPWTLAEMVRRSGYGPSQLSHLFREVTSLSPCRWLTEERVRRARDLLLESDKRVTEIAAEVGFGSLCHFTRVFHGTMGASPREYREAMRRRYG